MTTEPGPTFTVRATPEDQYTAELLMFAHEGTLVIDGTLDTFNRSLDLAVTDYLERRGYELLTEIDEFGYAEAARR